jgi:hypothetical protein
MGGGGGGGGGGGTGDDIIVQWGNKKICPVFHRMPAEEANDNRSIHMGKIPMVYTWPLYSFC